MSCKEEAGRQRDCVILENTPIARDIWRLRLGAITEGWLGGPTAHFTPGQFVNLMIPGCFLRRPIALCDWDSGSFTLVYKLAGAGTQALSALPAGTVLDVLAPLGNGFGPIGEGFAERALLIGGGCGVGPLYALAKALTAAGQEVAVALGFASREDAYLYEELREVADAVHLATMDGSLGQKGLVTALLDETAAGCARFYACGPTAMLKAVCTALPQLPGQLSLEERMACGFGGCMGCAIETTEGMRRVCADGPVFNREVLTWGGQP